MKSLCFIATLATTPLYAQSNCTAYEEAFNTLRDNYGETIQTQGLTGDGTILQMWANEVTGSWTALVVTRQGVACIVSSGMSFRLEPQGEDT